MVGLIAKMIRAADLTTFISKWWDDGTGQLAPISMRQPLAPTSASGAIANPAAPVQVYAGGAGCRYLMIRNAYDAPGGQSLWVNEVGGQAAANDGVSLELPPGAQLIYPDGVTTAVSVYAATPGHKFYVRLG